ncbi:hypothetical protein SBADM41S_10165 [Streptomyces badius]
MLYAGAERLDERRCTLGEPPLLDGAVLSLGAPADPEPHPEVDDAPARLDVVAGPDAGGVHLLHGGRIDIGRSGDADVPLDDPDVSRLHCAVTLDPDGRVTVADLGSTNGTTLDGTRVGSRPVRLPPGALLRLGESALRLTPGGRPATPTTAPDGEGHLRVARAAPVAAAPGRATRAPPAAHAPDGRAAGPPAPPPHARPVPVRRLGALRGVPGPGAVLRRGGLLAGARRGRSVRVHGRRHPRPLRAVRRGSVAPARHRGLVEAAQRRCEGRAARAPGGRSRPASRRDGPAPLRPSGHLAGSRIPAARHRRARLRGAGRRLRGGSSRRPRRVRRSRRRAVRGRAPRLPASPGAPFSAPPPAPEGTWPDPASVLLTALGPGPRLWERRPAHPEALAVRLGTTDRAEVPAVPVTADLREAGALGLAGPRARLAGLARATLAQLAALHCPFDLEIVLITTDRSRTLAERPREWAWLGWLPHPRPTHGQDCRLLLAYDREQAAARTAELLRRLDEGPLGPGWPHLDRAAVAEAARAHTGPHTVVVLDGDPGTAFLRETTARLAGAGAAAGIHLICLAETPTRSPPHRWPRRTRPPAAAPSPSGSAGPSRC